VFAGSDEEMMMGSLSCSAARRAASVVFAVAVLMTAFFAGPPAVAQPPQPDEPLGAEGEATAPEPELPEPRPAVEPTWPEEAPTPVSIFVVPTGLASEPADGDLLFAARQIDELLAFQLDQLPGSLLISGRPAVEQIAALPSGLQGRGRIAELGRRNNAVGVVVPTVAREGRTIRLVIRLMLPGADADGRAPIPTVVNLQLPDGGPDTAEEWLGLQHEVFAVTALLARATGREPGQLRAPCAKFSTWEYLVRARIAMRTDQPRAAAEWLNRASAAEPACGFAPTLKAIVISEFINDEIRARGADAQVGGISIDTHLSDLDAALEAPTGPLPHRILSSRARLLTAYRQTLSALGRRLTMLYDAEAVLIQLLSQRPGWFADWATLFDVQLSLHYHRFGPERAEEGFRIMEATGEKLVALFPNRLESYWLLGWFLTRIGRTEAALAVFDRATTAAAIGPVPVQRLVDIARNSAWRKTQPQTAKKIDNLLDVLRRRPIQHEGWVELFGVAFGRLIRFLDHDGDGVIERSETGRGRMAQLMEGPFTRADLDGSGSIDPPTESTRDAPEQMELVIQLVPRPQDLVGDLAAVRPYLHAEIPRLAALCWFSTVMVRAIYGPGLNAMIDLFAAQQSATDELGTLRTALSARISALTALASRGDQPDVVRRDLPVLPPVLWATAELMINAGQTDEETAVARETAATLLLRRGIPLLPLRLRVGDLDPAVLLPLQPLRSGDDAGEPGDADG
jgi:hypothetical protein